MWLNAVEDPNIKDEFERTPLLLGDLQASPHPYMDYMGLPPVVYAVYADSYACDRFKDMYIKFHQQDFDPA